MISFFHKITDILNTAGIPYMLSGSVAMGVYIVPRATKDFDFVLHLRPKDIAGFAENFKEGYYCDIDSIKDAVARKSIFNIIEHSSGYKADFIIIRDDEFSITEFNRRKKMEYYGKEFYLITVEDLLLSKIIWIQEFQSAIQMDDIKNLCGLDNLDWEYIEDWIMKLKLNTFDLLKND